MDKTIINSQLELTKQLLTKLRKYEELSKEQRQLGGKLRELNKNGGETKEKDKAWEKLELTRENKKNVWNKVIELLNDNKKKLQDEIEEDPSYRCGYFENKQKDWEKIKKAIKESEERIACAGCQFKYPKSEMLEKEVKGVSKWYCRSCALYN